MPLESYLLEDWGCKTKTDVANWVQKLHNGTAAPWLPMAGGDRTRGVCAYDIHNLELLSSLLCTSIGTKLCKLVEAEMEIGTSGPKYFILSIGRLLEEAVLATSDTHSLLCMTD